MPIRYIDELSLQKQRVFIRVDFNVPMKNGEITNDVRIKAAIPTIEYAMAHGARIILASHLGRPNGKQSPEFSLEPIAQRLQFYLKKDVIFSGDCEAHGNKKIIQEMNPGDILLLENLRFHPGEEANSEHFATVLSKYSDVYVDDAFGSVHRAHASVDALPRLMKEKGGGFLLKKEIESLRALLEAPKKPFTVVLGGAKVSDKIDLIQNLLDRVDKILIGGAMAYTFLKAQGKHVGNSRVEENKIDVAQSLLTQANLKGVELILPCDHVIGQELKDDTACQRTKNSEIPSGWMGLDIGPQTISLFEKAIENSQTILWNGPVGAFEFASFSEGTLRVAQAIGKNTGFTVVGGGDSVSAIQTMKLQFKYSHVSTGGGATLEFLEGKTLPGIAVLET